MAKPDAQPTGPRTVDETRKVADLKADPKNARRHSEAQIAQIAQIVRSIETFSYVNKVVARPNNIIIAGHATLEAVKRLGREDVECRIVYGLSEGGYAKLALALNKIPENSRWDDDVLAEVMGELKDAGEDLLDTGFSGGEIDKLLAEPDALEVKEIETGPVEDEFWISVRGPLKDQAAALKALDAAMKPFAGVTVDLGTINIG